ncbi:16791_t:CDS:2 [Funneliformis mosseae]|uniref:16791_t:CDS:1 n=1 Tax=Funneliformis mosseae TaxID=27381 RepID=A0A9N9A289_FUNMO|nr:16791_t:CDS:2 [Funneliformis mosseae]
MRTSKIKKGCDVHYNANLNNISGCPIGSKAWPLTLPWKVNYQKANGERLPEPNPKKRIHLMPLCKKRVNGEAPY